MADTTLQKVNGPSPAPRAAEEEGRPVLPPPVDVVETDEGFVVYADMPGVRPDDVDIRFENGELTLHGRRLVGETEVASYFRTFRLTDQIAADKIEAELRNGVLMLRLPKVEAVKPRRIAVKG